MIDLSWAAIIHSRNHDMQQRTAEVESSVGASRDRILAWTRGYVERALGTVTIRRCPADHDL